MVGYMCNSKDRSKFPEMTAMSIILKSGVELCIFITIHTSLSGYMIKKDKNS